MTPWYCIGTPSSQPWSEPPPWVLPEYLIVPLEGYASLALELRERLDDHFNLDEEVVELFHALAKDGDPRLNLEYHCLAVLTEYSAGGMYEWCMPIIDTIKEIGDRLIPRLAPWRGGQAMPYYVWRITDSSLTLQRSDLFQQQVRHDLRAQS